MIFTLTVNFDIPVVIWLALENLVPRSKHFSRECRLLLYNPTIKVPFMESFSGGLMVRDLRYQAQILICTRMSKDKTKPDKIIPCKILTLIVDGECRKNRFHNESLNSRPLISSSRTKGTRSITVLRSTCQKILSRHGTWYEEDSLPLWFVSSVSCELNITQTWPWLAAMNFIDTVVRINAPIIVWYKIHGWTNWPRKESCLVTNTKLYFDVYELHFDVMSFRSDFDRVLIFVMSRFDVYFRLTCYKYGVYPFRCDS